MLSSRPLRWGLALLTVMVTVPVLYYFFVLDWNGRPRCHKVIMLGFNHWMADQGLDANDNTNAFPNVNGLSRDSLMAISEQIGGLETAKHYRYVAGLRENDPGDLVLMYIDQPTRWNWHGHPPTVFQKRAWIIVPVDFTPEGRQPVGHGECSERLTSDEFKRRLRETLDFVRTNARPHWQTVVSEHMKFLESIENAAR